MQRNGCKINEAHINTIALKARLSNRECGYLWKRSNDSGGKWQLKWFALYQNFLFYYENVNSTKPLGLLLLESCYCNRIVATNTKNTKEGEIKLYCFSISYTKDGKNSIEFGAESEDECTQWMESIRNCSYNKQASQNAELEQKYLHLTQLYETESKSKWQYLAQIEELSNEVKLLREELKRYKKQHYLLRSKTIADEESPEMKNIKKVQSLCRGWLYRRRWKRIVKDYIESPHATSMRKRNRIVFELVEKEGEYKTQLEILVSNFFRPFRMAACSSKPPITHEEINCVFLNSEILLFLHQIFYQGLVKKLENWPSVFVGDLFDFLLPVLVVYQEYVRNHHYSLQILTDLKSKSIEFRNLLKRCEEKSKCEGRSLDVFLTYPMHQIPRYIIFLHQLITHTSQMSTNELKSLENAKEKLEELSRTMHDEVSETENIRCNLGIEKMIVEGCEVILDANQVFIREGLLILLTSFKSKTLGVKVKDAKKRNVVKCFLFTNHLIVTTRASNGKLNLFKPYEAIPLNECKIIEDVTNEISSIEEENVSLMSGDDHSMYSNSMCPSDTSSYIYNSSKEQSTDSSCEFKLIQTNANMHRGVLFVASSVGEKQAWCSDISQCIDNLNYSNLLQNTNTSNSFNMPNKAVHIDDPKLFNDDKDVKYCKSLNSCKVPQIRQATLEKLIERLIDLRFLSIDFLNTFLLTYRVFTDPFTVLNALKVLYESSPKYPSDNDIAKFETNNELNRRISVIGFYRLPSINEEQDVVPMKHRNSHIGTIRRDMAIDIDNINICDTTIEEATEPTPATDVVSESTTTTTTTTIINTKSSTSVTTPTVCETNAADTASPGPNLVKPPYYTKNRRISLNVVRGIKPVTSTSTDSSSSQTPTCTKINEQDENNVANNTNGFADSFQSGDSAGCAIKSSNLAACKDSKRFFSLNSSTSVTSSSTSTSLVIENLLNNLTKVNVSDGIVNVKKDGSKLDRSSLPLAASFVSGRDPSQRQTSVSNASMSSNENGVGSGGGGMSSYTNSTLHPTANTGTLLTTTTTTTTTLTQIGPNGADSDNEDYNSDEDLNLKKKFDNSRMVVRNKDHRSSNSSLNGSISSAASAATKLTYWNGSMEKYKERASLSCNRTSLSSKTTEALALSPASAPKRNSYHKNSQSLTTNQLIMAVQQNAQKISKRLSDAFSYQKTTNKLINDAQKKLPISVYAGVVVTSSRSSRRRISNSEATKAFAVATSGSSTVQPPTPPAENTLKTTRNSVDVPKIPFNSAYRVDRANSAAPMLDAQKVKSDWVIVNTAASMRVLNVLRHWITKHPLDFDENLELRDQTLDLVNEMLEDDQLTDTEKKVAQSIIQQLTLPFEKKIHTRINIDALLHPPEIPGKVKFSDLSVSEIAEQMTYIDYQIFCSISSQELLGQAWMKPGKEINAKNVLIFSKRFNEMSQLVVSEIVNSTNAIQRLEKLEKWTTIANICKFLKNFNGVLQIMSAFASTPVFRLKKTWEKISKNSRQTIDTLQNLVSSDGRFKNLRDAMHKCDPPCIPYLGMYLMDLVFIEESTPDFVEGNLINFSKLRMVSHIIRDIRTFQHSKYTIHHNRRVCEYLLDTTGLLTADEAYNKSLHLEPRNSIMTKK